MPNDIILESPYVGPRPFERSHERLFFGRAREISDLLSLVAANRVTVIYAQSGVGKTSLLNAGLIPLLEMEEFEVLPQARVRGLIPDSIPYHLIGNPYVFNTLISWAPEDMDPADLMDSTICNFLQDRDHAVDETGFKLARVAIFDQFEELFNFYPDRWEQRRSFFNQLQDALILDEFLHLVLVIREDYIAQLDPYADIFSNNLRTRYRVERMSPSSALIAIVQPLEHFPQSFAPGTAEQLVQELVKLRVESGDGKIEVIQGGFVEPVQLQVVCQNLWRNLPATVQIIDSQHLDSFGNVDQALQDFYELSIQTVVEDTGIDENKLRMWFDDVLITQAGTRGMVYQGPQFTGSIQNEPVRLLEDLHIVRAELRAGGRWYELNHDRFIVPIQRSNEAWGIEREAREQLERELNLRRRLRTQILVIGGMAIFIGLMIISLVYASTQRNNALDAQATAESERSIAEEQSIFAATQAARAEIAEQDALDLAAKSEEDANLLATQVAIAATAESNALREAENAQLQAGLANSVALASQSLQSLNSSSPELASVIAMQAIESYPITWQAEGALYRAMLENRILLSLRGLVALPLEHATWLPQNDEIITVDIYGSMRIFDATSGFLLREKGRSRIGDNNFVSSALVSPNGMFVILNELSETIIWNIEDSHRVHTLEAVDSAWLSNGNLLFVKENGDVVIYDLISGDEDIQSLPTNLENIRVTDDGKWIAASFEGTTQIIATDTGQELLTLSDLVVNASVSLSPNLDYLAAYSNGNVKIWNVSSGNVVSMLDDVSLSSNTLLVWSPDGRWIATNTDSEVAIWEAVTGELVLNLSGHQNDVGSISWSPDGNSLMTSSYDGVAYLWNVRDLGDLNLWEVEEDFSEIDDVSWSPDDKYLLVSGSGENIHIWDIENRELALVLSGHGTAINEANWSPDGTRIVSADKDGRVIIWDSATGEEIVALPEQSGPINRVSWSPDGSKVLLVINQGGSKIYDIQSGEELVSFDGTCSNVGDWSPSGEHVLTCSGSTILIWDFSTQNVWERLENHTDVIFEAEWSPNGQYIASVSADTTLRIWDASTGQQLSVFSNQTNSPVRRVAWAPNSQRLVTVAASGSGDVVTASIWDIELGVELAQLPTSIEDLGPGDLDWSNDGDWIAIPNDNAIQFWRVWQQTDELLEEVQNCCLIRKMTLDEKQLFGLPVTATDYFVAGERNNVVGNEEVAFVYFSDALEIEPSNAFALIGLGDVRRKLEDYSEAISYYERAIASNPQLATAYNGLGLAYQELEQYDTAIQNFLLAIELDLENSVYAHNLADVYRTVENYDLALTYFDEALEWNPYYARAYNQKGVILNILDEHEMALQNYLYAYHLWPDDPVIVGNVGAEYLSLEDYNEAVSYLDLSLEKDPDYALAYRWRGDSYYELGRYSSAAEDYIQAYTIEPNNLHAQKAGDAFFYGGDYRSAVEWFSKAINESPIYFSDYQSRGLAHEALGEFEFAIADLDKAIEINPDNSLNYYWRGMINLSAGNYEAALNDINLSAGFEDDPTTRSYTLFWQGVIQMLQTQSNLESSEIAAALNIAESMAETDARNRARTLGLFSLVQGNTQESLDYYRDYVSAGTLPHNSFAPRFYLRLISTLFPEREDIVEVSQWVHNLSLRCPVLVHSSTQPLNVEFFQQGIEAYNNDDFELAIAHFTDAIENSPSARNYNWRGWVNYLAGNWDEAVADHSCAIQLDPEDSIFYIDRAIALANLGFFDLAESDYLQAISIRPSYEFNPGEGFIDELGLEEFLNRISSLIETYSKAITLYPDNFVARTFRGNAYAIEDNFELSILDLEQAILVAPWFSSAYKALGNVYYQTGRFDEAVEMYQQYLEHIEGDASQDVINRLTELESED